MMHRGLRLSAFLAGLMVGGLAVLFSFDNPNRISLAISNWHFDSIPLWSVAVVPLVVGVVAGYLYHFPARLHHLREHMHHRGLVHELRKENAELSKSLDRLLGMPNDDSPAIAAAAAARDVTPTVMVAPAVPLETAPAAHPETGMVAAEPAPHALPGGNGHRSRRPSATAESMKDVVTAAAAAMPIETRARAPRPGRVRRTKAPEAG